MFSCCYEEDDSDNSESGGDTMNDDYNDKAVDNSSGEINTGSMCAISLSSISSSPLREAIDRGLILPTASVQPLQQLEQALKLGLVKTRPATNSHSGSPARARIKHTVSFEDSGETTTAGKERCTDLGKTMMSGNRCFVGCWETMDSPEQVCIPKPTEFSIATPPKSDMFSILNTLSCWTRPISFIDPREI